MFGAVDRLKRRALGPPERIPQRLLTVAILVTVAVATTGAWLAMTRGISAGSSSLPYLRPVLDLATWTPFWVILLAFLLRRLLVHRDRRYAEQAADVTGYMVRSVRRLAYEAKDPDGSTRVIASTGDEPDDIQARIHEALETGEDDTISLNPEAFDEGEEDTPTAGADEERLDELAERYVALDQRGQELDAEIDQGIEEVLSADANPAKVEAFLRSDEERAAPIELMDDEQLRLVEDLEEAVDDLAAVRVEMQAILDEQEQLLSDAGAGHKLELSADDVSDVQDDVDAVESSRLGRAWSRIGSTARSVARAVRSVATVAIATALALVVWHVVVTWGPGLDLNLLPLSAVEAATSTQAYLGVGLGVGLVATIHQLRRWRSRSTDVEPTADSTAGGSSDGSSEGNGDETDVNDPWREQYKLLRLDLASTINFGDLTWNLLVPAGLTTALFLLAVQLWVEPWFYPVIGALGLLVGIGNYVRISWTRSRRLDKLRQEHDPISFDDVAILVKEVEVPETRIYYAWLGDDEPRRYAHEDRDEFAEAVARRAYEVVEGVPVSPSILEKQAGQLESMHPDLHGFRDTEREKIMQWLLEHVEEAQHGLIPKAKLIEDAVEHDITERRFVPGRRGKGFDPEMVRECYRELVPAALVEQEVDVARDDADGGLAVTAVRLRSDPLPPQYGQIRSQFSSKFGNYAQWDALYELPDVSDRLDEEPEFVKSLSIRGEGA